LIAGLLRGVEQSMTSAAFVGALERFGRDRRANVALMFSLLAVPLMLAVGVGVDYGMAAKTRVQMQAALDAAVLAGAAASSTQSQIAALAVARQRRDDQLRIQQQGQPDRRGDL
jgi:Flp pilus assembly protein TadG